MPSVMRVRTPQESQMEVEDLKRRAEALKYQNQLKAEQLKSIQMDQVVGNTRERNNFSRATPVGQVVPRNMMQGYVPPSIEEDEKLYGMIQQQQAVDMAGENLRLQQQQAVEDAQTKAREMQLKEYDMMSAIDQRNREMDLKQQNLKIAKDYLKAKGIVPLEQAEGVAATDVAFNGLNEANADRSEQSKIMNLLSNDGEYEVVLGGDLLSADGVKLNVKQTPKSETKSNVSQNKSILDYAEKMAKTEYYAQAKEQGFSESEVEKPIMTQAEIAKYLPSAKEALGIPLTPQEKEQKNMLAKKKEAAKVLMQNGYEPTEGNIDAIIAQMQ